MAPKKATIEKELIETVKQIHKNSEELTVNNVRQLVEKKLNLEDGFLKKGEWKSKSKQIVHDTWTNIEAAAPSSPVPPTPPQKSKPAPKPKSKSKNGASTQKKPTRTKRAATPSDNSDSELSEITGPSDELSDVSEEPPKRRTTAKRAPKKRKAPSDDEDEESESSDAQSEVEEPPKKKSKVAAPKKKSMVAIPKKSKPALVAASDSDSVLSEIPEPESEEQVTEQFATGKESAKKSKSVAVAASDSDSLLSEIPEPEDDDLTDPKDTKTKSSAQPEPIDDESEMSDVLDEPPKPKRGSKGSKEPTKKAPKKAKTPAKTAAPLSVDEVKIKELQSQLVRCGVRKIWGFELKKYGDDNKAKARHLKAMLEDIGMTGRFSEARAKEIKEHRELMADLDAVKEGEKSWGLGGNGRPSRRRAAAQVKSLREPSDEDENEDDGGAEAGKSGKEEAGGDDEGKASDESDEDVQPKARGQPKARADLAFLDDESDSE